MALLDVTRAEHRHTSQRLSAEPVIWLGAVRPDGRPHHVPVWFAWHESLSDDWSFEQWRSTFSQPLLIHVNRVVAWTRTAAGVAYRAVP